jgi:methyl-accepting chemotaxis protein
MKKWSMNAKLVLILSIFIVASAVISLVGISSMSNLKEALGNIVAVNAARVDDAHEIKSLFLIQLINEKNFIIADTKENMDVYQKRLNDRNEEMKKQIEEAYKISSNLGKNDLDQFKAVYNEWWQTTTEEIKLSAAGDNKNAFHLSTTKGRELRLKGESIMDHIIKRNQTSMKEEDDRADNLYSKSRTAMMIVSVLSVVAGILFAFFMMKAISRAINRVIDNLKDSSEQVTSAAQEIAASSHELSGASTEQASSLEETASSIEELNSMVQKNAENATKTFELADHSRESATRGKEVVQNMMNAIGDINVSNNSIMESINESNRKISEIVNVISEIGNKTKVINDIVFQTKLLSFNASVEAARAGENGKGFAVVAEEVGNLASMSGNAAQEIATMLDESIKKVEGIVDETKKKVEGLIVEGKNKVAVGTRIAKECGVVLDEIVVNIGSVTTMASEISSACQEQAAGVQEINKAMGQLDQVTQTNSATSEQTASAAQELSAQAESLSSVINVLVETIRGSKEIQSNVHVLAGNPKGRLASDHRHLPGQTDPRFSDV